MLWSPDSVDSGGVCRGMCVAEAVGCELFALQWHFNCTSMALPRHFHGTSKAKKNGIVASIASVQRFIVCCMLDFFYTTPHLITPGGSNL